MQTSKRRSHVKSGCRTCKLCDGYGVWGGGSMRIHSHTAGHGDLRSAVLRQYTPAVAMVWSTEEEKMGFEFFCKCPSLKISGTFKSKFWDHLLIQASVLEPVIFHAAVAVGSAYRIYLQKLHARVLGNTATQSAVAQDQHLFKLQQYNKAIRELNSILTKGDIHSIRAAAMTCLLFVCLEMMNGQQEMMESHYRYAIILMQRLQRHQMGGHKSSLADEYLKEAFARLTMQLNLLGQNLPEMDRVDTMFEGDHGFTIPPQFDSIRSARQALEALTTSVLKLRDRADALEPDLSLMPPDLIQWQANLQTTMSAWRATYQSSMKTVFADCSIHDHLGLRIFKIYYTMASIILGTCLSHRREITFDAFTPGFASLISQVEDIWKIVGYLEHDTSLPSMSGIGPSFSIEMGTFPALYYTALKCRNPSLRRRAIFLILRSPHAELIWSGPLLGRIASKVMALEEGDWAADRESGSKEPKERFEAALSSVRPREYVPEKSRFHQVKANMVVSDTGTWATLTCTRFRHEGYEDEAWETNVYKVNLVE
ncbi:putative Zn(2)-C6 fungal-type domain-containing protein [Seiridium unicorne]|uniref:Zn(2)-C6 fungal-type domain-containing protein n=1 Tax=Seiridium unicorne TaxID=138068 RepID=A0ABR2VEA5_9PEZI